jgi:hypothetical protein
MVKQGSDAEVADIAVGGKMNRMCGEEAAEKSVARSAACGMEPGGGVLVIGVGKLAGGIGLDDPRIFTDGEGLLVRGGVPAGGVPCEIPDDRGRMELEKERSRRAENAEQFRESAASESAESEAHQPYILPGAPDEFESGRTPPRRVNPPHRPSVSWRGVRAVRAMAEHPDNIRKIGKKGGRNS